MITRNKKNLTNSFLRLFSITDINGLIIDFLNVEDVCSLHTIRFIHGDISHDNLILFQEHKKIPLQLIQQLQLLSYRRNRTPSPQLHYYDEILLYIGMGVTFGMFGPFAFLYGGLKDIAKYQYLKFRHREIGLGLNPASLFGHQSELTNRRGATLPSSNTSPTPKNRES